MSVPGWIVVAGPAVSALALVAAAHEIPQELGDFGILTDLLPETGSSPLTKGKIVHTLSFAAGVLLRRALAAVA